MERISEEVYSQINNEIYNQEGERWWHSDFSLNLIKTFFNPVRLGYSKKILEKLKINPDNKTALEIGCGGGLLCEEIARLGFDTAGIDPSEQSLAAASEHAGENGLEIKYIRGTGEALPFPDNSFDTVFCCDVLEHVRDLPRVISEISRVLIPGGVFIYDTFNRTLLSKLAVIMVLQEIKYWAIMPPHLHEWKMFIRPEEIKYLLRNNHLSWEQHQGIMPDISVLKILKYLHMRAKGRLDYGEFGKKFHLVESSFINISYMGYAIRNNQIISSLYAR
jgi:2-polyprenyl-6-hydroxyphenyl methylase / 3-demethylubiquinone-9 3-methyltransferase